MIGNNICILFLVGITYVPITIMIIKSDIYIYISIVSRGTKTNVNVNNNITTFIAFFKTNTCYYFHINECLLLFLLRPCNFWINRIETIERWRHPAKRAENKCSLSRQIIVTNTHFAVWPIFDPTHTHTLSIVCTFNIVCICVPISLGNFFPLSPPITK